MKDKNSPFKSPFIKNLHLGISSIVVILVGLIYGIYPGKILPILFDFRVETIDLKNVFRAIMGLYLGMGIFWIIGIYRSKHWQSATITNIVFMGGLAFGRIISLMIDGTPSIQFTIGLVLEIFFALWGINNLKNKA